MVNTLVGHQITVHQILMKTSLLQGMISESLKNWPNAGSAIRTKSNFRCVSADGRQRAVYDIPLIGVFSFSKTNERCIASPSTPSNSQQDGDKPLVWCNEPYMVDGQGVLTHKNSRIEKVCDVGGEKVAVLAGTTAVSNFSRYASTFCGLLEDPDMQTPVTVREVALEQVERETVSAYATNVEILNAFANDDNYNYNNLLLVSGKFGPGEKFVIAVKPDDANLLLLNLINEAITDWMEDGTLEQLMIDSGFKCINTDNIVLQGNLCGLKTIKAATPYSLEPGDTLSGIAINLWGESKLWPCIAEANPGITSVDNPLIPDSGQLHIPARPNDPAPDADPEANPNSIDCTPMP